MVASVFPGDVGATAWLAPPSAVPVFADGLLSGSCNWRSLYKQHELQMLDKMLAGHAVADSYAKLTTAVADAEKERAEAAEPEKDPVQETKKRMRMFLSITDIDNFLPPRRSDAVVFVYGTEDEYIGFTEPQWEVSSASSAVGFILTDRLPPRRVSCSAHAPPVEACALPDDQDGPRQRHLAGARSLPQDDFGGGGPVEGARRSSRVLV
jgi:hypothetical protein